MPGITAEDSAVDGALSAEPIGRDEIQAFLTRYDAPGDKLDVVVFTAPQLSLFDRGPRLGRAPRAPGCDRAGRDLARDQARRRPHGSDRPDRSVGRGRRPGDLLLPELRPRDGRGQWLDPADDQFGQARQHHRGLRPTLASLERCVDSAVAGRVL